MIEAEIKLFFYEIAIKQFADNPYLDPTANEAFAQHAINAAKQSVQSNGAKPSTKMCNEEDCYMCDFWMSQEPPHIIEQTNK